MSGWMAWGFRELDPDLDTPVAGAVGGDIVGGQGAGVGVAAHFQALAVEPAVVEQDVGDGHGAGGGEFPVGAEPFGSDRAVVRVAADDDPAR